MPATLDRLTQFRAAIGEFDPELSVKQEESASGGEDDCINIYDGDRKIRRVWDGETREEIVAWLRANFRRTPRCLEEWAAESREKRQRDRERLAELVKQA